jgi:hypothetical protein
LTGIGGSLGKEEESNSREKQKMAYISENIEAAPLHLELSRIWSKLSAN